MVIFSIIVLLTILSITDHLFNWACRNADKLESLMLLIIFGYIFINILCIIQIIIWSKLIIIT